MATSYQLKLEEKVAEGGEIVRWLITIAVSIGALLEVIDTSIVNVALPYIKGNLGATLSEVGWVVTAYSMANAVMIPLTAWLGDKFGRKRYFVFSLIGFTIASILCGLAPNLPAIVLARILQGLFGGGLLAKAQSILFETFPREKQGLAQALFGVCVMVGPILGPTLGGYLTDALDWRWIFYVNIPIGIFAVMLCWMLLPEDGELEHSNAKIDYLGITLLTIGLASIQYVLEKGQDDDWFASRTIVACSIAGVLGLIFFIAQELTVEHPAVDLKVLRRPSVAGGVLYSLVLGAGLYGVSFVIPNFAQSMLNYTATQTGLLQVPGSVATAFMMPLIGQFARKIDARFSVALGAMGTAAAMLWLGQITLNTGWDQFYWPLILRGASIPLMYMPLTLASIGDCKPNEIASATGFMNLSRQLGGSVGIAALTTILARRTDYHRVVLDEKLTMYNPDVVERFNQFANMMHSYGVSPHDAQAGANAMLNQILNAQSTLLSYEDLFWLIAMIFVCSLPVVFLLAKGNDSKANKEAAAAAH
jgi:DHA2 family multidrug resistance protein